MRGSFVTKATAALAVSITAGAVLASDEDIIRQAVADRAKVLNGHTWTWQLYRKGTVQPGHMTVPSKGDPGLKRSDSMQTIEVQGYQYEFKSLVTAFVMKDSLRVDFESCALDPGNKKVSGLAQTEVFGSGYQLLGSYSTGRNLNTGNAFSELSNYNVVKVTANSWQDSASQFSALLPTVDFRPELALFLTGANPLNLYGLKPESITSSGSGFTVKYHYDASKRIPGTTVTVPRDITIQLARDGRPISLESISSGKPFLKFTSAGFSEKEFPLNSQVSVEYHPGGSKDVAHMTYTFDKFQKKTPEALLDAGVRVIDWRLSEGDMVATEYPPRGTPKTYQSDKGLMAMSTLDKATEMKWDISATSTSGESSSRPKLLMGTGAGVFAICGGFFLLRRRSHK